MDNNTETTINQTNRAPSTIEVTESVQNLDNTKKHFLRVFLTTLPIFFGISVLFHPGLLELFTDVFIDFSFDKFPEYFSWRMDDPWSFSPFILGPILSYFSAFLYAQAVMPRVAPLPLQESFLDRHITRIVFWTYFSSIIGVSLLVLLVGLFLNKSILLWGCLILFFIIFGSILLGIFNFSLSKSTTNFKSVST